MTKPFIPLISNVGGHSSGDLVANPEGYQMTSVVIEVPHNEILFLANFYFFIFTWKPQHSTEVEVFRLSKVFPVNMCGNMII